MPDIRIKKRHGMPYDEARKLIEKVADDLSQRLGIGYRPSGDDLKFKGRGVKGTISLDAEHVHLEAELGMFLKVMRASLEDTINRKLDEYLA